MRRQIRRLVIGVVTAALCGAGGGAVHADRLVTKDGHSIETKGPWRVDGRLVVFTRTDGSLASMRSSEVDLEASRQATEEEKAAAAATVTARQSDQEATEARTPFGRGPDAPRKEPVARLTEKDLPPVGERADARDGEPTTAAPDAAATGDQQAAGNLRLLDWKEGAFNQSGLSFTGSIRNDSKFTAVGVTVTAHLFDENDEEAGTSTAVLTSSALLPGERADFRAAFPGKYSYKKVTFDVDGELLLNEQNAPGPESGTGDTPPDRDAGSAAEGSGG